MEKDSKFVIVIGREFGSGGRSIGRLVSQKLGIEYYDSELLNKAAEYEGLDLTILKEHEEKRPSMLKALIQGFYGIPDNFHPIPFSREKIYDLQSKVIRELSQKESCVIVGRNADYILRNHPKLLSVFLHSPIEKRAQRIISRGESKSLEEAIALASMHDKRRESFYNFYTGEKKWGVASNYHLCLDTGSLSNEDVAEIIFETSKKKFNLS